MRSDHLIEAALQAYGGRALLNSITLLDMETKVKLLKRYGGMAVFLPLDKDGIPSTARKRALLASKAVKKLGALGFGRERILFDPIVMSLATGNDPQTTLHTLRLYKKKGYLTVMGLSNISYGLPHRPSINHYFLDLCTAIGLDAVIMDPSDKKGAPHIDLGAVFSGKQEIKDFIAQVAFPKEPAPIEKKEETELELLLHTMLEGEKEKVIEQIEALLRTRDYERIIEESLRPALDEIGKRYGRHEIFLPQLIMAAETAQAAFGYLQRRFSRKSAGEGKVIIATVKGDLHDIGKNIVAMMLRNGGFEVEDLGKDVPSEDIVQHALKKKADIIALSALMTTTAMKMKEVIALAKKSAVPAKVIIGGACITKKFAEEIGAHAYASDASGAVREVKRLLAKKP
jgi:5-methyltetrahydrofolate--homocysteine methyltransferase